MSYLSNMLVAASAVGFLCFAPSAFAETQAVPYDPVAHAITFGLTPEDVDAAFDAALHGAESCDKVADQIEVLGCASQNFAESALVVMLGLTS
jgi:hypothetical protein